MLPNLSLPKVLWGKAYSRQADYVFAFAQPMAVRDVLRDTGAFGGCRVVPKVLSFAKGGG